MHELSIAMSLLDLAAEEVERQGGGRVLVDSLEDRAPVRRRERGAAVGVRARTRRPGIWRVPTCDYGSADRDRLSNVPGAAPGTVGAGDLLQHLWNAVHAIGERPGTGNDGHGDI